jgi:hypothetical protein
VQQRERAAGSVEGDMKPTTLAIAGGVMLASLAVGAPAQAQSVRIAVGAVFQTGPHYPAAPPYRGRPGPAVGGGLLGYGARDYALNRGFNDGYEQGFEAAHDRDRFEPRRERWYRDAKRGYDRDYRMSKNEYRDVYRRGFLDGYEAGYRDGQRGRMRGPDWYGGDGGRGGWRR